MKEDYLWDKTGEDAEIQALENALKAFRFQENGPPALPQKVFTIEKTTGRRFFQFRFALAASFATIIAALAIVWFQTGADKTPVAKSLTENGALPRAEKIAGDSFIETRETEPVAPIESFAPEVKPNVVRVRRKSAPAVRASKAVLRKAKTNAPSETLTAEEKDAYNQLMLALSITGSQLKIVRDKVQGIEERNAALDAAK